MLVLSRSRGESLMLGDDIEITVLEIRAGQVKLGLAAPRALKILRTEIWRCQQRAGGNGQLEPRRRTA